MAAFDAVSARLSIRQKFRWNKFMVAMVALNFAVRCPNLRRNREREGHRGQPAPASMVESPYPRRDFASRGTRASAFVRRMNTRLVFHGAVQVLGGLLWLD